MGKYKTKYSAYRSKKKRLINRRRKNWRNNFRVLFFRLVLFIFILICFWVLFFSQLLEVKKIVIVNQSIDKEKITQEIKAELKGEYWGLIHKNNLILLSKQKIKERIIQKFERVRSIEIIKKFPDTLKINIKEREARLIWCLGDDCYLVDEKGQAFFQLNQTQFNEQREGKIIIKQGGNWKKTLENDKKVLTKRQIAVCQEIKEKMEELVKLKLKAEFSIPTRMIKEVRVSTEAGWQIYFSFEHPLKDQLVELKEFLKEKTLAGEIDKLEYVDLRIKGKIIYRLQESETEQKSKKISDE